MQKQELIQKIQQDIKDLQGLINYEQYCLSDFLIVSQAKNIAAKVQDHLKEFINYFTK